MATAPSVDNYESGGLTLSIGKWSTDTTPPQEQDVVSVGNCLKFSEEPKVIKKNHKSHMGKTETIDKKVKVREECSLKFTLDEVSSIENLRMYFQGVIEGTDIYPMEGGSETYLVRITQQLVSGTERVHEWHKVEISASAAIEMINHGEAEGDWATAEFTGECLDDSSHHPDNKWGRIYLKPTE
jgi:hypothetical protein